MEKWIKWKYLLMWIIIWLSFIWITTYAAWNWSIWGLFQNVSGIGWRLIWTNIKDETITSNQIKDNTIKQDDLGTNLSSSIDQIRTNSWKILSNTDLIETNSWKIAGINIPDVSDYLSFTWTCNSSTVWKYNINFTDWVQKCTKFTPYQYYYKTSYFWYKSCYSWDDLVRKRKTGNWSNLFHIKCKHIDTYYAWKKIWKQSYSKTETVNKIKELNNSILKDFVPSTAVCLRNVNVWKYKIENWKIYKCILKKIDIKGSFWWGSRNSVCRTENIVYSDLSCWKWLFRADWYNNYTTKTFPSDYCRYVRWGWRYWTTWKINEMFSQYPRDNSYKCLATWYKWYWKNMN